MGDTLYCSTAECSPTLWSGIGPEQIFELSAKPLTEYYVPAVIDIAALLTMPSAIAGVTVAGMHSGVLKSPRKHTLTCCSMLQKGAMSSCWSGKQQTLKECARMPGVLQVSPWPIC